MRISGGKYTGRQLRTLSGFSTRPTTDKVRQSIFNILMHDTEDASVLDLFAGSGALGIEALSRGAKSAAFVDFSGKSAGVIKMNLKSLGLKQDVYEMGWTAACKLFAERDEKFDLIFADPPYNKVSPKKVIEAVYQYNLLGEKGLLIIEHKAGLEAGDEKMVLLKKRKFGQTEISFYTVGEQ